MTELELLRKAFERERLAREKAEELLENRASTLFQINQRLLQQYESVAKKSAEIEFLHAVANLSSDALTIESALQSFLDLVCKLCEWPIGHIYKPICEPSPAIISAKIWHISDPLRFADFKTVSENYIFKLDEGLPGQIFSTAKSIWIKDLTEEKNFPRMELLPNLNVRCAFGVPIKIAGKVIAVAEFFIDRVTDKDASLTDLIETGAAQLSTLLERHEAQRQLKDNFEALKQTQMQLVQSEKMASLGTIAAGVAHEINNPISFVLSNTETLSKYAASISKVLSVYRELEVEFAKDEKNKTIYEKLVAVKATEDIDYIAADSESLIKETLDGISRIKDIVQGLKTFSRVDEAETKEADVNECIESTLKVIWNELKYKCTLEKKLGKLPPIVCYPGQLVQVFTNLLINSAQAIENRGTITIESLADDNNITLRFSDTGRGIAPEHIKNIFTPFFTTKPVGKGTGLGLSISYGIIKKHGGEIDVKSEIGKGTTFTITLPIEMPRSA